MATPVPDPELERWMARSAGRLAAIVSDLPDAYEEDAWIGVRWRIRAKTFVHLAPVDGSSPAFTRASGFVHGAVVITFRSTGDELDVLSRIGDPYFKPPWSPTVVGLRIWPNDDLDWTEVTELVTESYCFQAPKKLASVVRRR